MKKFWNFTNSDGDSELRLEGAISDESWWGDEVTPKQFREELSQMTGDLTVWINSPGGDVFAADQIYAMLKEYPGKVTVKIDAVAASAASVVAMAGDEVLMSPVAMMMIHDPSTIAMGNESDMREAIKVLKEVKESIISAYMAKTGKDHDTLASLMKDEGTWMYAKRAVELGFADGVLYSDNGNNDEGLAASAYSPHRVFDSLVGKLKAAGTPDMPDGSVKEPAPADSEEQVKQELRKKLEIRMRLSGIRKEVK